MKKILPVSMMAFAVSLLSQPVAAAGENRTVLVLDASGSMWGQIEGEAKITIARRVVEQLLGSLPADEVLGLYAYGHREKGNCADIEALVPAAAGNAEAIRQAVRSLTPKGKTPLSDAVARAAEELRFEEDKATVILVSDGRETCDRDPCAVARALEEAGSDFTAHVIGFDVADPEEIRQLSCIADETGGQFLSAANAPELVTALEQVAVKQAPVNTGECTPPASVTSAFGEQTARVYMDSRGGKVELPSGDASFADEVVKFLVGSPAPPVATQDPDLAIGPPDFEAGGSAVTLGCGGTMALRFADNALVDVPGPDLHVFEVGPDVEPTFLAISADGTDWMDVGEISGGRAEVDIGNLVQPGDSFRYVRLEDRERHCGSRTPGADIDSVAAIGSIPCAPEKTSVEVAAATAEPEPQPVAENPEPQRVFFDDFDGTELAEHWVVRNPDPDTFIVDDGELLIFTGQISGFDDPSLRNLIMLDRPLPEGDWDAIVRFRGEFTPGRDQFWFGLYDDHENFLASDLGFEFRQGSGGRDRVGVTLRRMNDGESTHVRREVHDAGDDGEYQKLVAHMENEESVLTLSKRGRAYSASYTNGGLGNTWQTDNLRSLRLPGRLALGISKWANTDGEVMALIDSVEIVGVGE